MNITLRIATYVARELLRSRWLVAMSVCPYISMTIRSPDESL